MYEEAVGGPQFLQWKDAMHKRAQINWKHGRLSNKSALLFNWVFKLKEKLEV